MTSSTLIYHNTAGTIMSLSKLWKSWLGALTVWQFLWGLNWQAFASSAKKETVIFSVQSQWHKTCEVEWQVQGKWELLISIVYVVERF